MRSRKWDLNAIKKIDKYEQTNRLQDEIENKIDYFAKEYDLSVAEVLGILRIIEDNILIRNLENKE